MKKAFVVICLFLIPFACVYSQSKIDSVCKNIFKAHLLKIRYEAVQSIYKDIQKKKNFPKDGYYLNRYFEAIRGFPIPSNEKCNLTSGVNPGELMDVEWMSEEEMNKYIEQLNCTPEKALKEYIDFIKNIKLEKEVYLKCIDVELAKGDSSEYANDLFFYNFHPPMQSLLPTEMTKLDFLKVFKEFIFSDNAEILPDGVRVSAYLKYGCKIP